MRKVSRSAVGISGGVEGALAQRAEVIFATLTGSGANIQMEKAFQRLFTRLVTLGEGQEDTRRVVKREELGDGAWSLAQRLAGESNRLVVTNAPSGSGETVEVVHEALIRHWPKLAGWINRDRAFQSWLRQIKPNIEAWFADPADEGTLLRGGILIQAKDWLEKRRDDLSEAELGFIEASAAASELQQKKAARVAIWTRIAAIAFLALFLAISFFAVGLIGATSEAEDRSQAAFAAALESARQTSRAQAAVARIENDNSRYFEAATAAVAGLSVPLAVDEEPSQIAAWAELLRTTVARFLVPPLQHQGPVSSAAFDPKGERIVTTSWDNTARIWDARIWDARTGEAIGEHMQHQGGFESAQFDPKGERIVTAGGHAAVIWDTRTHKPIGEPLKHDGPVWDAAFDPKGERIVTASTDGTARIWDARTGKPIGKPLQHQGEVYSAAFDPKGERIVTASTDGTARIWDVLTGAPIGKPLQHQDSVTSAAFDPKGERVVTASWDNTVNSLPRSTPFRVQSRPFLDEGISLSG